MVPIYRTGEDGEQWVLQCSINALRAGERSGNAAGLSECCLVRGKLQL